MRTEHERPRSGGKWLLALLLLLVAAGGGWAAYRYYAPAVEYSDDPQVAEVQKLVHEITQAPPAPQPRPAAEEDAPDRPDSGPSEAQRENFRQLREKISELSPQQREQLGDTRASMFAHFRERMNQRVESYFALEASERSAFLDEQIDRMQNRGGGFGPPGRGRGGRGPGQQSGPPDPDGEQERREERRKRFLDNTTPEQRAKWTQYFSDLQQRREERGLPTWDRRF